MRNPSASQIPASSNRACPTSDLFPGFAQRDRHVHLFLAAIDRHPHRVPRAMIIHDLSERLLIVDTLPIDGDDQIATNHDRNISQVGPLSASAQSSLIRRSSLHNLHDE